MLKGIIRFIFGHKISRLDYPLIVNSYGRSGSTVLTKSIIQDSITVNNSAENSLVYRALSQTAWDLDNVTLQSGVIYKTHDYPPSKYPDNNLKTLYTFAEPVDVVMSLLRLFDEKGEAWMREHYKHLKVSYNDNFKEIIHEDQLQLENHLDRWMKETRVPIAFIRYETMWDYQKEISEFLGINIELPPYQKRKSKNEKYRVYEEKISNTYHSLIKKVNDMENFIEKNN